MVKSAAKRTLKYSVKDDPWVIAMRYKRFMQKYATPILTAQMEADNIDAEIETILEKCGYSRLNRFNALTFLRSLPKIVGQYQNPDEAQFMLDRITELGTELGLKGDQVVCLLMALRAKFVKEGFVGAAVSERVRIYTKIGQLPRGQNAIAERVFCNTTFPTSGEFLIEAANSSLGIPVSLAVAEASNASHGTGVVNALTLTPSEHEVIVPPFQMSFTVSDPTDSIVLGNIKDPSTWKYYPYTRTWRVSFSNFETGIAVNLKSGEGFGFAKPVFSGYVTIYLFNDQPSIIDRGILGEVAPDGYAVSVTINDLPSGHSDSASGLMQATSPAIFDSDNRL